MTGPRWLKITKIVSFYIASEASYVYILSGQIIIKNATNWWKTPKFKKSNATFLGDFQPLCIITEKENTEEEMYCKICILLLCGQIGPKKPFSARWFCIVGYEVTPHPKSSLLMQKTLLFLEKGEQAVFRCALLPGKRLYQLYRSENRACLERVSSLLIF